MDKKKFLISVWVAVVTVAVMTGSPAVAEQFTLLGKPLNLMGYVTQGESFSLLDKDKYDTEKGLQSALMNLYFEGDYAFTNNLKFYGAGMLTVDWIYQLKDNDSSWNNKLFSKSMDNLNVDGKYWQVLKEAHVTWNPENFLFRIGKQIVAWGETDGFRLMDQINPLDQRRGFADVEFETSIIPIWLLRAEYHLPKKPSWLQELGFEFVFNPNADFIPNQGIKTGNDEGGIWAPNILIPLPPPPFGPGGEAHLGSAFTDISKPDKWKEGQEFGFRVKGVVKDAIITLNAFYGRDNDPVLKTSPTPPLSSMASDGKMIIRPFMEGKYPLFRFVGATFSRDIVPLKASFLGGVAPVVRLEAFYAFKNTFATTINTFEKSDELRWAIGVDWRVKIPFLNANDYFNISPQFYHRRIIDYPSKFEFSNLEKDNYATTLMFSTTYFHTKLTPSFFWTRDINNRADMFRLQLTYDYSNKWRFTLGTMFLHGEERGKGFEVFDNKDQLYFKISYKWG